MTIHEIWETIPEHLHDDIYLFVASVPTIVPINLFLELNAEQLELVMLMRRQYYKEKKHGNWNCDDRVL